MLQFEVFHQIKYLQPFTTKILLFILPSLSICFMSLTTMFCLLVFNEQHFNQEKKLKKNKITKDICHQSFPLDKIISLEDLNLIN